jgi:hypothetical protein
LSGTASNQLKPAVRNFTGIINKFSVQGCHEEKRALRQRLLTARDLEVGERQLVILSRDWGDVIKWLTTLGGIAGASQEEALE